MKTLKNIAGAIFTIWAGIVFILTMLIFWIPMWVSKFWNEPKKTAIFINITRIWMAIVLPLCGIRLTIKGKEKFRKGENYIVVCNHNSMMDVPISSPGIPGPNKTIAKIELSRIPLFGMVYKRGSVLLDRMSEQSRKDSINEMKKVLELGMHMCIYPEGTRNKTNKPLKEFHDGAFRLAVQTGKPIMPAVIFNTRIVLPFDKVFYLWPHPVAIHYLDPVNVQEDDDPQLLKEKIFRIMWDYIEQSNIEQQKVEQKKN
jgi:1-acyl-sn-glycerol-3-phosphate acyltransferase